MAESESIQTRAKNRITPSDTTILNLFKSILFSCNTIIAVGALVLIVVAIVGLVIVDRNIYADFGAHGTTLWVVCFIMLGLGILAFAAAFLGCIAATKEKKIGLIIYAIAVVVIAITMLLASVTLLIKRAFVSSSVTETMRETLRAYDERSEDNPSTRRWNDLQSNASCCGVDHFTDWWLNPQFDGSGRRFPQSCCKEYAGNCDPDNPTAGSFHTNGCSVHLHSQQTIVAAIVGTSLALVVALTFALLATALVYRILYPRTQKQPEDYEGLEDAEAEEDAGAGQDTDGPDLSATDKDKPQSGLT